MNINDNKNKDYKETKRDARITIFPQIRSIYYE